ncbi:MAG: hypothetical protein ACOX8K_04135 [Lachnospiraceae bacterium]|jgi:hypothetical protein
MFGFKKKEKKPLFIKAKDVFSIIKSDYDAGVAFCLLDFNLEGNIYTMGSVLIPDSEEKKENIYFVFEDKQYDTYEEFIEGAKVGGMKLFHTDAIIEVLRAGIIDGEPMIKTPWGDTRLAKMAIK